MSDHDSFQLSGLGPPTSVTAIEIWNADPKPFVWTKTADQILDARGSLLRGCPRTQRPARVTATLHSPTDRFREEPRLAHDSSSSL